MSTLLGPIRQLGYVVDDIEAGMKHWSDVMGVGPWFYNPRVPIENYTYDGEAFTPENSVALANSGPMQVELIQCRNDVPSMYRDFRAKGLRGLQHVAFWTTDYDADLAKMQARGFTVKMSGCVGVNGRFAYFAEEHHPGTCIELSEVLGPKGRMFDMIRDASVDWDGLNPVRPFPGPVDTVMENIVAEYLLETPFPVDEVAAMMAGEQSSGTFVRVAGETDELRARAAAQVLSVEVVGEVAEPSLVSAYVTRRGRAGPFTRARVRIGFPPGNIGCNLPTLAATVSGNLYDIGEITGLRLLSLRLPASYRARYPVPVQGIAGTRAALNVEDRPIFGTIIKPNVGMTSGEIAALVGRLCAAGVDFIKDDEVCANPDTAPLAERVPAVMAVIRKWQDKGRPVMMAFNITDETDAMRRHADLVAAEGGTCVMASLNWCGLSGMETLRNHSPLAIHAHRNGFGAMSRHPLLGMAFPAYQTLYRLAGIDHMHVHGIGGKFVDSADEVIEATRACLSPLTDGASDQVMPAFSSGQWAGTMPSAHDAAGGADFMFMCGGGILAHPDGPAAGIASLREAWEVMSQGGDVHDAAQTRPALAAAVRFFGAR